LAVKPGEVYNRIISVGDVQRAADIAALLDSIEHKIVAPRGFVVYSGKKMGYVFQSLPL